MKTLLKMILVISLAGLLACEAPTESPPTFNSVTATATQLEGFFDLYWRADEGKLYLEVKDLDAPFLYVSWLARGVGSNDVGLDRGQMGATRIVRFQRSGPRLLLIQDNLSYRANSADADERRAVEESFAVSVLGGFDVVAEQGPSALIDVTSFFQRDAHGLAASLLELEEGGYAAAADLSAIYMPSTRSFPDNTEIEALVTFMGAPVGDYLPTVVPDPTQLTVHLHHSLVRLPDDGFAPVVYEPRAGYIDPRWTGEFYQDYATAIDETLLGAFLPRHRLKKKNPAAAKSSRATLAWAHCGCDRIT